MSRNTIIIEFVGPPGAGKSTCCRFFSDQLRRKGIRVSDLRDIKAYLRELSLYHKFYLVLEAVILRGHALLLFITSLTFHRIYSKKSIFRFIRLTLLDMALKQFRKNNEVDIVLLEQWMIQELWSSTIFKVKSYDRIKDQLSRFYFKTDLVLYFDIDVPTAAERISRRETNHSRFDRMDPDKRFEELMKCTSYLHQLYENSDCKRKHLFSTRNSPQKNTELFIKYLNMI